jgi:hypothetical protein
MMLSLVRGSTLALMLLVAGCSGASASPSSVLTTPPPIAGSLAATPWDVAEDPPEGFGPGAAGYLSPDQLLQALLRESVSRDGGLPEGARLMAGLAELEGRSAVAWIQIIGFGDDSVVGDEIELTFARGAAGWYVEGMRFRSHCGRGVDAESHLCL